MNKRGEGHRAGPVEHAPGPIMEEEVMGASVPEQALVCDEASAGFDPSRFDTANIDYEALHAGCPKTPARDMPIQVTVVGRRCVYINEYCVAGGKSYYTENLPSHDLNTSLGKVLDAFQEQDIIKALKERSSTRRYYTDFHAWKRESAPSPQPQAGE